MSAFEDFKATLSPEVATEAERQVWSGEKMHGPVAEALERWLYHNPQPEVQPAEGQGE